MKRVAVSFTFHDDIKTIYGHIRNEEPLTVAFPTAPLFLHSAPVAISIYFIGGDKFEAEMLSFKDNEGVFKLGTLCRDDYKNKGFSVDYKTPLTVVVIKEERLSLYQKYCEEINGIMRNKLSVRLKEILKREDSENIEIFSFLFDMNAKLDEILSLLRPPFHVEGGFEARSISLSGDGILFYTGQKLEEGCNIFIRLLLSEVGDRFNFAAIGHVSSIKYNSDGSGIYKMAFSNLDIDIKDAIVRFLFAREREILKEARI